jgi:hypothetical protein
VGKKHTLGCTGGARCEHDAAQILGLGSNDRNRVLLTLLDKLAEAQDGKMRVCLLELLHISLDLLGIHLGGWASSSL